MESKHNPKTPTQVASEIKKAVNELNVRGELFGTDANDLMAIAKLLNAGHIQAARDSAAKLDTCIRDELPQSFFDHLKEQGIAW